MNHAYYDDADNIVLWNPKPASRRNSTRSVIVLHSDDAAGEIIALRLRSEGFGAVHQSDVATVELMLDYWRPCALLIDTRSATDEEFRFVEAAAANPMLDQTLLIAITDPALKGTTIEARKLRRPLSRTLPGLETGRNARLPFESGPLVHHTCNRIVRVLHPQNSRITCCLPASRSMSVAGRLRLSVGKVHRSAVEQSCTRSFSLHRHINSNFR
jgi:hypothetical protein